MELARKEEATFSPFFKELMRYGKFYHPSARRSLYKCSQYFINARIRIFLSAQRQFSRSSLLPLSLSRSPQRRAATHGALSSRRRRGTGTAGSRVCRRCSCAAQCPNCSCSPASTASTRISQLARCRVLYRYALSDTCTDIRYSYRQHTELQIFTSFRYH